MGIWRSMFRYYYTRSVCEVITSAKDYNSSESASLRFRPLGAHVRATNILLPLLCGLLAMLALKVIDAREGRKCGCAHGEEERLLSLLQQSRRYVDDIQNQAHSVSNMRMRIAGARSGRGAHSRGASGMLDRGTRAGSTSFAHSLAAAASVM